MARLRKVAWYGVAALGLCLVAAFVLKLWWDSRYYEGYDPGLPLEVRVVSDEEREGYVRAAFSFQGVAGERVPTLLTLPSDAPEPYPCIIFLHGIGQDKRFLDEIVAPFAAEGFAMASFDQYTRGERRQPGLSALGQLLALRRRAALTVLETRRLVDYLVTRPDIDPQRIYLVGASFGAITGSTAAAFEPRIAAVVLTYGGGDLRTLFASEQAANAAGFWLNPMKHVLAFLLAPGDPVRYVHMISPRPLLLQNGIHDSVVPAASGQALYDAAREPKQIVWYDTDHIGLDEAHVRRVLDETIQWFKSLPVHGAAGA